MGLIFCSPWREKLDSKLLVLNMLCPQLVNFTLYIQLAGLKYITFI